MGTNDLVKKLIEFDKNLTEAKKRNNIPPEKVFMVAGDYEYKVFATVELAEKYAKEHGYFGIQSFDFVTKEEQIAKVQDS